MTGSVESQTGRFEIKTSANGKFHFNLKSGNGETILSSELYNSRSAAEKGVESVKKNAEDPNRYERKLNKNQEPYFVLKAQNGEIIGTSEVFSSEAAVENTISAVMSNAPTAVISNTASYTIC
ncbi:MAG: YegP family protein, partial [Acidobacteriota bacterium]|nr:YegP family protein [Acidobacteriota bacterium]